MQLQDASNSGNPCPLAPGPYTVRLQCWRAKPTRTLPLTLCSTSPSALQMTGGVLIPDVSAFKMTEEWLDQDGKQICCATVSYQF